MEEFLKQAREFNYSFFGGLFFFIGGLLITITLPFAYIQKRRLWLSILGLFPGAFFSARLFSDHHTLLGSLLAIIVIAVGVVIIIIDVRKRKQAGKP